MWETAAPPDDNVLYFAGRFQLRKENVMAKKPDPKEALLLALYTEYNRDAGDYRHATAGLLEMEKATWLWSLMMLKTDGLVDGVKWVPPGAAAASQVLAVNTKHLHLTKEGVEKARELVGADGQNRRDALVRVMEWFAGAGLEVAKEYLLRNI